MNKLLKALALTVLVYVVPVAGTPDMLLAPPLIVAATGALLLMLAQPEISARDARRNRVTDRNSVLTILLAGVLAHVIPVLEWRLRGFPGTTDWPTAMQVIGMAIILIGLLLRLSAVRKLGRFFTPTVQTPPDHRLITSGPYRFVRHPSYTGAWLAMVGHALVLGAPWSALLVAGLMFLVYRHRISVEETLLHSTFGVSYELYQEHTRRLFPYVW